MSTLIVHPTPDKLEALKAFLKALKISFEESKSYDPEFVAKVKRGARDLEEGKGISVSLDEIWK